MKPFTIVLVGVCLCAGVFVDGLPRQRVKRQTTSETPSSSAAASSSTAGETEGTTSSTAAPGNNEFGIGAAAGIGGLTRSVGIGSFQNPNSDALAPWGAFAGLNLGNGGRIGAGCSGLSCGIQLGQLVLATPQLLGIGRNFLNSQENRPEGKKLVEETDADVRTSESNSQNAANGGTGPNHEQLHTIFRDAFRGFRETLASFFRAPVTHFIKKHVRIDNSTESAVGPVKSAEPQEEKTFRIQLTPSKEDENENSISDSTSRA